MNISLEEINCRQDLFPVTLTRRVADIRLGIFTLEEKWERYFGSRYSVKLVSDDVPSQSKLPANLVPRPQWNPEIFHSVKEGIHIPGLHYVERPWQLVQMNDTCIRDDFSWFQENFESSPISATNQVMSSENIFLEEEVSMEYCMINASKGPVYIGKGAEIMEGTLIRGPVAIGEGSIVKMGSILYGGTTIGPYCMAGGEIKNSILLEYSNKAHHGYLGDSVIGAWCNLGAGTSNSNLKNTAGPVKVWNMAGSVFESAGSKCGVFMGDYCTTAINTSLNTGSIVGVCANIFRNTGLTEKFIPSFSWGPGAKYELDKALENIRTWKGFKNKTLSQTEETVLRHIFDAS